MEADGRPVIALPQLTGSDAGELKADQLELPFQPLRMLPREIRVAILNPIRNVAPSAKVRETKS
jgi:hypothetical protein